MLFAVKIDAETLLQRLCLLRARVRRLRRRQLRPIVRESHVPADDAPQVHNQLGHMVAEEHVKWMSFHLEMLLRAHSSRKRHNQIL